jgi:hypothetical protein
VVNNLDVFDDFNPDNALFPRPLATEPRAVEIAILDDFVAPLLSNGPISVPPSLFA